MNYPYRPWTTEDMSSTTWRARERADALLRAANDLKTDMRKAVRLKAGECPTCFYLHSQRIGGAAMTDWHCGLCGKEDVACSTHTPKLCAACAEAHNLCRNCGGDMDLRFKRRKWPTAKTVEEVQVKEITWVTRSGG